MANILLPQILDVSTLLVVVVVVAVDVSVLIASFPVVAFAEVDEIVVVFSSGECASNTADFLMASSSTKTEVVVLPPFL